jgi:hypothetical protein
MRQIGKLRVLRQGVPELIDRTVFYVSLMSLGSVLPIDVLIPAADKDADVLPYTIDGVRRNVRHPISNVFIVAPRSARIESVCRKKGCEYVDERALTGIDPDSIHVHVGGVDRSKWVYQQFLKWSGDAIVRNPHYLVVDADTILVRPQVFERNGRTIFNYSDEYYQPYFDMYRRLLKESVLSPVSFTSHQMLFEIDLLRQLKNRIEEINGCKWHEAILKNLDPAEMSSCSDYDTYGQYVFAHFAGRVAIEYWFNLSLTRKNLRSVHLLTLEYAGKYKSVSFHSYKEPDSATSNLGDGKHADQTSRKLTA